MSKGALDIFVQEVKHIGLGKECMFWAVALVTVNHVTLFLVMVLVFSKCVMYRTSCGNASQWGCGGCTTVKRELAAGQ